MIVKVNIEELKKAVADMTTVMKGNELPILDCLFVNTVDNAITITVNNLNMSICKNISGDILKEGQGLLNYNDLNILLKMKGDVTLEFSNCQCIADGSRIFKFNLSEKAEDFPLPYSVDEIDSNFTIAENELLYCLKLKKLIADSAYKTAFRGIWVDKNNLLACDGNRLGKIEIDIQQMAKKRFMMPDYAINFFAKALDKNSDYPATFYLSEDRKYVKAVFKTFEIIYRQYEGDFLTTYDEMFSLSGAEIAEIPKQDFISTIGFMRDVYKSIYKNKMYVKEPVEYLFCDKKLKLTFSIGGKYIEETIPVVNISPHINYETAFQAPLTYELLTLIDGEKLSMSFTKRLSPSILFGEKENERYLMLPLRPKNAA